MSSVLLACVMDHRADLEVVLSLQLVHPDLCRDIPEGWVLLSRDGLKGSCMLCGAQPVEAHGEWAGAAVHSAALP